MSKHLSYSKSLILLLGFFAMTVGLAILLWINFNLFISKDEVFARAMGHTVLSQLFWIGMGYASSLIMIFTGQRWIRTRNMSWENF